MEPRAPSCVAITGELLDLRDRGFHAAGFERPARVVAVELEEVLDRERRPSARDRPTPSAGASTVTTFEYTVTLVAPSVEQPLGEHVGRPVARSRRRPTVYISIAMPVIDRLASKNRMSGRVPARIVTVIGCPMPGRVGRWTGRSGTRPAR